MLNVTIPFYLIIKIHHTNDLVDVIVHNCSIRQNYAFFYKDKWQCICVTLIFKNFIFYFKIFCMILFSRNPQHFHRRCCRLVVKCSELIVIPPSVLFFFLFLSLIGADSAGSQAVFTESSHRISH